MLAKKDDKSCLTKRARRKEDATSYMKKVVLKYNKTFTVAVSRRDRVACLRWINGCKIVQEKHLQQQKTILVARQRWWKPSLVNEFIKKPTLLGLRGSNT